MKPHNFVQTGFSRWKCHACDVELFSHVKPWEGTKNMHHVDSCGLNSEIEDLPVDCDQMYDLTVAETVLNA